MRFAKQNTTLSDTVKYLKDIVKHNKKMNFKSKGREK